MGEGGRRRQRRTEERTNGAVIPYLAIPSVALPGGLRIDIFAVLACLGVAAGCRLALRRGRESGVPLRDLRFALFWTLCAGFLGAHLVAVFLYAPALLAKDHLLLLKIGHGMSSLGGFAGACAGAFFYFRGLRRPWLVEADILVESLIVGWVFGRLGCALVHDHLGARTALPWGVQLPGGARHDLGLYEFLFTLCVLWPAARYLRRMSQRPGSIVATACLLYAPMRFALDFLREGDTRYLALTPAQWGCIALAATGACLAGWLAAADSPELIHFRRPVAPAAKTMPAFPIDRRTPR